MSISAHAVVFEEAGRVVFRQVSCPDPGPDDLVIRTRYSWISNGTEGSFLRGERTGGETPYVEGAPRPFPLVPGYQKVGVVEAVGERVAGYAAGDEVFATISRVSDMFSDFGGHVSPAVTAASQVSHLPGTLPAEAFSGAVLTQVGYNCAQRPAVGAGDPAVVIGDGLVGQWAAQGLWLRGADVLMIGHREDRLRRFGPSERRRAASIRGRSAADVVDEAFADGVAVIVDTAGHMPTLNLLATRLRHLGHIVSAGFYGVADAFRLQPPRAAEAHLHLVSGWRRERLDATIRMIGSGELSTLPLITHRLPADAAADAWRLIQGRAEPVLGVILDWEEVQ